ncbi:MAG: hypothetical protein ACJ8FU_08470 [Xanthobacteraceae bacterium]
MSEKEQEKPVLIGGELLMSRASRYSNYREPRQMQAQYLEFKGRMATALIERWGLVAAKPNGEDSAGRAQAALMGPAEIVKHACDTAEQAIEEFKRRGWFHALPEWLIAGGEED